MSEQDLSRRAFESNVKLIEPTNGVYRITPVMVGNDYFAVAPIAPKRTTNIYIPDAESCIGIIIGVGPLVAPDMAKHFPVGCVIKFETKPVLSNLDNLYQFYGPTRILLMRCLNILAMLPDAPVQVIIEPSGVVGSRLSQSIRHADNIEDESGCVGASAAG